MATYLQLSKIQGSCTDPHHPGWLQLESFSFHGTFQNIQGHVCYVQTLNITLAKSEVGYVKLAQAALTGQDVGPGLVHVVVEAYSDTLLPGGFSTRPQEITEYRIGKKILVESQAPTRIVSTFYAEPSALSGSFLLHVDTVTRWQLPLGAR